MKQQIKVNINRPPVSAEEIAARRDFNEMLKKLADVQKPFYLKPWFFGMMAGLAIVIVASILIATLKHRPNKEPQAATNIIVTQSDSSAAPVQQVSFFKNKASKAEVRFANYSIDVSKGGSYKYRTGSRIFIPANAFTDEQGSVVKGKVELRYREFHNAAEIIASGIPMTYDSAGNMYHFQSAGMFEIRAYQNGQVLLVNPGKTIKVEMAGKKDGANYSEYVLDTAARNWAYQGPAKLNEGGTSAAALSKYDTSLYTEILPDNVAQAKDSIQRYFLKKLATLPEIRKPEPPKKADNLRQHFNLDVLPEDFPELADYKNLTFEIGPENKNFDPSSFKVDWEDVKLDTLPGDNKYKLTLSKGTRKLSYVVYPVFQPADYDKAVKTYRQKYDNYVQKKQERLALEKKAREDAEKAYQEWIKKEQKAVEDARRAYYASLSNSAKVTYILQVNRLGFWNCDQARSMPHTRMVLAEFEDAAGKSMTPSFFYLVEKDRNAIFTYVPRLNSPFGFDPGRDNMLVTVGDNGKVYVFRNEGFAQIPEGSRKFSFRMEEMDNPGSPEALARFLGFGKGNDMVFE